MTYLIVYLFVINVITFIYMGIDKRKAKKHTFRIPEKVLLSLSFLGGSLGTLIGMFFFHHKTHKCIFKFGIPVLFLLNLFVIYLIYR
ncbi:DUF1294 domain-containing protein [uncultured Traorella sp.]|uniref:DUF1294 domain-containing protein n=1 Tax=uncultured Traorella sp. TaxID=1929048 RepID=UPI0025F16206|nr:DUF1294 domain-containing protein [uncultured Traorella sp.]